MIRLLYYLAWLNDTPQSRGSFGEMITASIFNNRFFGDDEHYLVNNLIFETSDEKTHQIDHVLIYRKGIFCIESKNIDGLILGHPDIKMWKVYINGPDPYDLYNPIMQNKGHIKVLSEFLENKYQINSIVVFDKGNKPKDCGDELVNIQDLKDYIKNYPCEEELDSETMKEIFALLTDYKKGNDISIKEHIDNIKNQA